METGLLSILSVGFILGMKHALEPDHVIAVSTIAGHSKKLWRSSLVGVFWGIGHTATLFLVGMFLILMKNEIPAKWAMSLEFLVGIMLAYLGITSMLSLRKRKIHVHEHEHSGFVHKHFHSHERIGSHDHTHQDVSYVKSMVIGLVHGLAGSAAMVLLAMATVSSVWEGLAYILVFGAGTVVGMLCFTTMIAIPFVFTAKKEGINRTLTRITGVISTAFGLYYMYNLGITEGLFKLWI
ncbi:sulfite exporter TauE/SafE family protein [Effusibacillus consociatus]|uniref:Sulfite exporter TauE/SafE family protein n=1 Tax=Effusibacillus consociatus TaxID=1117041 RepID=A0ABV9PXE6_9BACL